MVVWEDFATRKDTVFCGVFDGHGPYGHLVARRVRDSLPSKLVSIWKAHVRGDPALHDASVDENDSDHKSEKGNLSWTDQQQTPIMELIDDEDDEDEDEDEDEESGRGREEKMDRNSSAHASIRMDEECEMFVTWRDSFLEAFDSMDRDLRKHASIDCFCSGSTAVTVLKQGDNLVIANVGDSRAVLATRTKYNKIEAIQLTVDLKPNLPREAERILKCKGRVFALEDEPEVARVWLPYDDAPGLAMARAFGDFCLKDFGLIAVPEVTHRKLDPKDEFIVLATDGIWDVLSNKEVVDIVASAPTRTSAARALVETAVRAWRLKYPNSKVDDCAVVCMYLQPLLSSSSKTTTSVTTKGRASKSGREIYAAESAVPSPQPDLEEPAAHHDDGILSANAVAVAVAEAEVDTADTRHGQQPAPAALPQHANRKSVADVLSSTAEEEEEEWSALEGVVRVNSLLQLPRFLKGGGGRRID